ncbi:hypothetical protein KWH75_20205 [Morganella morganii]|uniref:hypothetical protein n=1 Tax=Morganella morganii TaxID=582 RepID=UPI0021D1C079|nr:hypothetical protein [Morganella morganii]MCU6239388.1 hypothetical protein [Morganella morganii]
MSTYINVEVFNIFVRYLIQVAKCKRFVPYSELENIFGFSHNMVGVYAGQLANFCNDNEWPLLNTLIINLSDMSPTYAMDEFFADSLYDSVEENQIACFKYFHNKSTRNAQVKDFTGLNTIVRNWCSDSE